VNDAPITPGDILEGKSKISIKMFKVPLITAYYVVEFYDLSIINNNEPCFIIESYLFYLFVYLIME
jgi:hypothetical protein